jgi:hypothetical protein
MRIVEDFPKIAAVNVIAVDRQHLVTRFHTMDLRVFARTDVGYEALVPDHLNCPAVIEHVRTPRRNQERV